MRKQKSLAKIFSGKTKDRHYGSQFSRLFDKFSPKDANKTITNLPCRLLARVSIV